MSKVQGLGSRIKDRGFWVRVQFSRSKVRGSSFIFEESRCRVHGLRSKFRVQGPSYGFKVQGPRFEFKIQGLGFRVQVQVQVKG